MPYPEDYIINTDLATINNTGSGVGVVTLPSGQFVPAGSVWTATQDVAVGGAGSLRVLINSSKIAGMWYPGTVLRVTRTWSNGQPIDAVVSAWRINTSTVRIQISLFNPGTNATAPAGNEVFTVRIANMGMPF